MCNHDCSCVGCTVAFGQQLASLFHIWTELTSKGDVHLDQVLYDIEVSTSALSQLNVLPEQDKTSPTQIFTPVGHQEIETLVIKCNLIFKAVILLVQKATEKTNLDSDDDDRKVLNCPIGKPGQSKQEGVQDVKSEQDEKADEKSQLLIGPVPSLTSPKTLGLIAGPVGKRDWLSERVTHCQIQLRWLRKSLLLHVQLGRLTLVANQGSTRDDGSFEAQAVVRAVIIIMWKSQQKFVECKAHKQERAEQQAQRRLKAQKEADTASVHSASSQGTASTVVVEAPRVVKGPSEKIAPVPESIPPASIANILPGPIPPGIPPAAQPTPQLSTKLDNAEDNKEKISSKLSTSFNGLGLKVSETMSEWTHKIFGKEDEFSKDWESQELEAWVFRDNAPYSDPIKVPFGHQRLQYGLKKIKSRKSSSLTLTTFARYLDGGPRVQMVVNEIAREANRLRKRERVCLAFENYRRQDDGSDLFTIVFFSIRDEKAPIKFEDCIGRKMTLPFEMCRTWNDMRLHIVEAFLHIPGIGPHVMEGHFSLQDAKKKEHILPGLWSNTIKPGDSIVMVMWPNLDVFHPLRIYHRPPPFGSSPRQVAQNTARQERGARMQAVRPMPPHLQPGMLRPFGHMGPRPVGRPPPPFPRGPPPQGVTVIERRPGRRAASSVSSVDEDKMTEAEEKELTFVDFVEERHRMSDMTTTDILVKYTQLHDASGQELLEECQIFDASAGSDSDSDFSDTSGSSGSRSLADD